MPRSRIPSFFQPRAFGDSARPAISASAARVPARAAVPAPRALPAAPVPAPAAAPAPVPAAYVAPIPASADADVKARLRAILNHPEADGRETLAKHLAFESSATAAEVVAHLAASPRAPSPLVASGAAGAAVARQALGLPADAAADRAVAEGVAALLAGPVAPDAAAAARWSSDFEEGARTARELLGRG